jgi:hypothetical protein
MMVNQGIPAGLLGISMMNAGIVVAMKELGREKGHRGHQRHFRGISCWEI